MPSHTPKERARAKKQTVKPKITKGRKANARKDSKKRK